VSATQKESAVADAIRYCFVSPNVSDSNLEAANIVDTLDDLARAGHRIATAIDNLAEAVREARRTGTEDPPPGS
jgi:hypothetical protein